MIIKKGNLALRQCDPTDVEIIANNMRLADVRECALVGVTPKMALEVPFIEKGATGFTITHNNKPIAMCGVTPMDNYYKMGRIWFLGTTDLHEMPLKVFRHAKICLAFLVKNYEEVENFVPYDHWENIAWLVKLGFKVEKTPYYLDDHHFYRVFYCNFQKTDTKIDKSRPIMH